MGRYRKKSVVVEAEQFFPSKTPWPDWVFSIGGRRWTIKLNGRGWEQRIHPGTWIITDGSHRHACDAQTLGSRYEQWNLEPAPGSEGARP